MSVCTRALATPMDDRQHQASADPIGSRSRLCKTLRVGYLPGAFWVRGARASNCHLEDKVARPALGAAPISPISVGDVSEGGEPHEFAPHIRLCWQSRSVDAPVDLGRLWESSKPARCPGLMGEGVGGLAREGPPELVPG